jgi:hypothetical protein
VFAGCISQLGVAEKLFFLRLPLPQQESAIPPFSVSQHCRASFTGASATAAMPPDRATQAEGTQAPLKVEDGQSKGAKA